MIKLKDILNEAITNPKETNPSELAKTVLGWFDFYTDYIDDGGQRRRAIQKNDNTLEWFNSHPIDIKQKAYKMMLSQAKGDKSKIEGTFGKHLKEATLTEKKYYVTYNKGRGQGKGLEKEFDQKSFKTTDKPKVFNSYNDAKKYAEKMEKMFQHSIGGGTAYWVSDEKMNPIKESIKEAKSDYPVYHYTYTSAIQSARDYAEKKGYEIDDEDAFRKIGMGPRKPSDGKTNRFSIELTKNGKPQKKMLHIQVYGMGTYKRNPDGSKTRSMWGGQNEYELNAYIN
jgi:hypothetical protein